MNDYECEAQNNTLKVGFLFCKKPKTILKHPACSVVQVKKGIFESLTG
jgi:hypothetical protein